MIEPERQHFEEIKERGKRGALLGDDFEWLATELDSYSRAWKTERDNLRKLTEFNIKLCNRQEKIIGALKALADKAEQVADLEYEIRMAREAMKEPDNGGNLAG